MTLPGFYDGVGETPDELRAIWDSLDFDAGAFLASVGLKIPAGETGRSVLEQIWSRPTAEVNGMIGGYTGDGFKTVIPSRASAKVSFRLVGDQDPARIRRIVPRLCARARARRLPGRVHLARRESRSPAAAMTARISRGRGRRFATSGASSRRSSAPAGRSRWSAMLKQALGMDSLMIGFAHDDDRIHSPNEKYDVASFRGGIRSWARVLAALAE